MAVEEQKTKLPLVVDPSNNVVGSLFAQLATVSVDDLNITLEFVFVNQNDPVNKSQIVTRVTLPRPSGEELSKTILNTVKLHEERKKEKKGGTN